MTDLPDLPLIVLDKSDREGAGRRAFAYERISDEVQGPGLSLEFQGHGAERYAGVGALRIVDRFSVVESASKEGRKVFNQMLDRARREGVRDLIFKNTDRMSRNYQDLVRIDKLIDEEGFNIHFYQSNLVINKDSSYNDRFLIGIQLAVAKHTSDKISQDIREHNRYKASQGIAPGPSPFGYRYDKTRKAHEIDTEAEGSCRFIFDEFDKGEHSLGEFIALLNEKEIRTPKGAVWRKSNLHYMLTNPFYHGEFSYQDKLWPGNHPPLYPRTRFVERLERLGDGFRGRKKRTFEFPFSGMLRCSCGRTMTGEKKKGRYVYYGHRCARTGRMEYVPEGRLLEMLDANIGESCFSPMFAGNLKRLFRDAFDRRRKDNQAESDRIEMKRAGLNEKRSRLLDLYTDNAMDRESLNRKMTEINSEADRLELYRASLGQDMKRVFSEICDAIDYLRDRPREFLEARPEQKAVILRNLAERVTIHSGAIQLAWTKPHSFLMRPALLELHPEEGTKGRKERRTRVRTSSKPSSCAPPAGLEPAT